MKTKIKKIVYFGDSITYALGHDHKGVDIDKRWTNLVDSKLKNYENKGLFNYSSNQGVNGDTTRLGLLRINDVYKFKPDLVVMQFGYNDCNFWVSDSGYPRVNINSFKFNLIEIVNKLRVNKVKQIILCTNYLMPIEVKKINNKSWNENIKPYNQIIRLIAKQKKTYLIDLEKKFVDRTKKNYLHENGKWLHLSTKGNVVYYKLVANIIKNILIENK